MYKKTEIDISETRRVLISAITSKPFLRALDEFADPKLMEEQYAQMILEWCFEFYRKFEDAPQMNIKSIFERKQKRLKEADILIIEDILTSISDEYAIDVNSEYMISQAELYFNKLALNKMAKTILKFTESGKIDEAISEHAKFRKKQRAISDGVDMLRSDEAIRTAFNDNDDEILFQLPGVLGKALGPFYKGGLSCVMAPAKRGKSWSMLEVASYAMYSDLKVWYFTFEMTKTQMWRRIWQSWSDSPRHCDGEFEVPKFNEFGEVELVTQKFHKSTAEELIKLRKEMMSQFRLSAFETFARPKNSFKVSQLREMIETSYLNRNSIPDVIVLDYADIMLPDRQQEKRQELDQIWGDLSAIAEEFNLAVVTGTQTNRSTFTKDIEEGDSSEANSKMTHVDKAWAINQDSLNKEQKLVRYSCLFNRHDENNSNHQVAVLQNLACGKAMLDSKWVKDIPNIGEKK